MKNRITSNRFRLTVSFLLGLFIALAGSVLFSGLSGLPLAPTVTVGGVGYIFVNSLDIAYPNFRSKGVAMASPLVTIFARDIQENLFPDNSFYRRSLNDDAFVVGAKVNLPQAGAKPSVSLNRSSLPATIAKRTDTSEEYDLGEFTTDPTLIQDTEEMQVNYNKRASVLMNHWQTLNEKVADFAATVFYPTASGLLVPSTGGARAASAPGATGNRKRITKEDIIEARRRLNAANVPLQGRCMLINADMEADMLLIPEFTDASKIGEAALKAGIIGRILGFDVFVRSKVASYSSADSRKAFGAATATGDKAAALLWHPNAVRFAAGSVKVFADEDKPEYYGSVYSAMVNAGGRIARTDEAGVVAILETATA